LIDWNDEDGVFVNKKSRSYLPENALRRIFKDLVDALDYSKLIFDL
jgi:hypothetical protein